MKKVNKETKIMKVLGWVTAVYALLAFIGLAGEGLDYATLLLLVLMGFDAYYLIKK